MQAIVEEAAATPEQLSIRELNVGAYCFSAGWLWPALQRIPLSAKGEYYLTDTVELAAKDGLPVQALVSDDLTEVIGINTRVHLAEAEAAMRMRINAAHMLAGVTIVNPGVTYIDQDVTHRRGYGYLAEHLPAGKDRHRFRLQHRAKYHCRRYQHRRWV